MEHDSQTSAGVPIEVGRSARGFFYGMLALLLVTIGAYWGLFAGQFTTWDDDVWIQRNAALAPPAVWGKGGLADKWTDAVDGKGVFQNLYTPVTHTVWYVVSLLAWDADGGGGTGGRLEPVYFKVVSFVVHLAGTLGVFFLIRMVSERAGGIGGAKLAGGDGGAIAGGAGAVLFALHPMQVESVAWASGLKDVLWTALMVWSLVLFVRAVTGRGRAAMVESLALLLVALLTKPTAVVIPAMMAVLAAAVLFRRENVGILPNMGGSWRMANAGILSGSVLAIPFVVTTAMWQTAPLVESVVFYLRPLVATDALGHYLAKVVMPWGFALDYGRSAAWVTAEGRWVWNTVVVGVVVVWLAWWRDRVALAGGALAVIAVGPVLGLKDFDFATFSVVSDHYAYPLMVGVAMVVGAAARVVYRRAGQWWGETAAGRAVLGGSVVVGGVLAGLTWGQVWNWRDSATLYQRGLEVVPRSAMMNSNYAAWLQTTAYRMPRGEWDGMMRASLEHADRARVTFPSYPQAHYISGIARAFLGQPREALRLYIVAAPYFATNADFQSKLGDVYAELDRLPEAERHYSQALRLDPADPSATRMLPQVQAELARRAATRPTSQPSETPPTPPVPGGK